MSEAELDALFDDVDNEEVTTTEQQTVSVPQESSLEDDKLFDSSEEEEPVQTKKQSWRDVDTLEGDGDAKEDNDDDDDDNVEYAVKKLPKLMPHAVTAQNKPESYDVNTLHAYPPNTDLALFFLPNVAAIDDKEFIPESFDINEFLNTLSDTRKRVTGGVYGVVRWRSVTNEDGSKSVESNTRLIRWPDGLVQLQVGSEYFTVTTTDEDAAGPSYIYHEDAEDLMRCVGTLTKRIKFAPTDFATARTHKLLRKVVQSREMAVESTKTSKVLRDIKSEMAAHAKVLREEERKNTAAQNTERSYATRRGSYDYEDIDLDGDEDASTKLSKPSKLALAAANVAAKNEKRKKDRYDSEDEDGEVEDLIDHNFDDNDVDINDDDDLMALPDEESELDDQSGSDSEEIGSDSEQEKKSKKSKKDKKEKKEKKDKKDKKDKKKKRSGDDDDEDDGHANKKRRILDDDEE